MGEISKNNGHCSKIVRKAEKGWLGKFSGELNLYYASAGYNMFIYFLGTSWYLRELYLSYHFLKQWAFN